MRLEKMLLKKIKQLAPERTQAEIARELFVSPSIINRIVKQHNISCKKAGDLVGKEFGNWRVLQHCSESRPETHAVCICLRCNKTVRDVDRRNLISGKTIGCGCRRKRYIK